MGRCCLSVHCWEVVNLQHVVVFTMLWLSVGHVNNEETRLDLLNSGSFLHESWDHLIWTWLTYSECLSILALSKDPCVHECLALVRHHVAVHINVIFFHLENDSDVLWHLEAHGVGVRVLLLQTSGSLDFFSSQEGLLIDLGENLANSLKPQAASNQVDLDQVGVLEFQEAIHLSDLRWVIDGLYVDADSFWVVRILRVIPIEVSNSLL